MVGRNEYIWLDHQCASNVDRIHCAQRRRFQPFGDGGQNIRSDLTNIGIRKIGYRIMLESQVIDFGEPLFPDQSRQCGNQFRQADDADGEAVCLFTQRQHFF